MTKNPSGKKVTRKIKTVITLDNNFKGIRLYGASKRTLVILKRAQEALAISHYTCNAYYWRFINLSSRFCRSTIHLYPVLERKIVNVHVRDICFLS